MTKRLQVLLDDEEFAETQRIARRNRVTVSEWVRQALRQARRGSLASVDAKLAAIASATRHQYPTADIERMLDEIEAGRDST